MDIKREDLLKELEDKEKLKKNLEITYNQLVGQIHYIKELLKKEEPKSEKKKNA